LQANNQKAKEIARFIEVYIRNSEDLHKKLQKIWVRARATAQAGRALKPPMHLFEEVSNRSLKGYGVIN